LRYCKVKQENQDEQHKHRRASVSTAKHWA